MQELGLPVAAMPPLYGVISMTGVLFIFTFGARNVAGTGWAAWDIAAFTTFLSCFGKLAVKSSHAAKLFNAVQKAEVSWKRIKPLMKQPEQLAPLRIPEPADVTLENLSFAYGGEPVFTGLSLTARPGDIIGITGPVACGKSTFGRVFLCEAPYGGSAKFGKTEFAALTPRQISATVGYLGHDPELSADTVQNNVLCGSEQDAMPWLAAAALDGEVLAMENGVDTVIGPSGTRLSGGQAQRLALARTLAQQSPVLLLDELAAGLDLARMLELFDLLERRRRAGAALLLVMHDCNLAAQYATRLLGLREGRVLFDGPVRRCFTAENLRALYAVDLHIVPHPRNGLPQALPLRPRGPEYREDSPHEA